MCTVQWHCFVKKFILLPGARKVRTPRVWGRSVKYFGRRLRSFSRWPRTGGYRLRQRLVLGRRSRSLITCPVPFRSLDQEPRVIS
ncbi:hypothetical protein BRADI_4g13935v3 [Brachypodium distachyon]|uniref:Uncharacterized protein n=1 Tax=Brachypodium distachyon TaxID=15368 RepID=A0A2K2CMP1_BRADI|nr:hypothetical protein BRADI_4g13935v3 [Brachypodium distachyon]